MRFLDRFTLTQSWRRRLVNLTLPFSYNERVSSFRPFLHDTESIQFFLNAHLSVEFWATRDTVRDQERLARESLHLIVYEELVPVLHGLRASINAGDKDMTMDLLNDMESIIRGKGD